MRLDEYCKLLGISLKKLADQCGIPVYALYNYKKNDTLTVKTVVALMIGTEYMIDPQDLISPDDLAEVKANIEKYRNDQQQKENALKMATEMARKKRII